MPKPITLQEKKLYQNYMFLDLDSLVYIPANVDPFYYLENYPDHRLIPIYTVTDHPLASGVGLNPENYFTKVKANGNIYNLKLSNDKKKIQLIDTEDEIEEEIGQTIISHILTGGSTYYLQTSSTTYTTVASLLFGGTTILGNLKSISCLVSQAATSGSIRIYDTTNFKTLAEETFTNTSPEKIQLLNLTNIPTGPTTLEIQLKRTGKNAQVRIYSIEFIH